MPLLRRSLAVSLLLLLSGSIVPQQIQYFNQLQQVEATQSAFAYVDSLEQMPYQMMVDNLELAGKHLKRGISEAIEAKYKTGEAHLKAKLGTVFYLQGKYDSSTFYNLEAIALYQSLKLDVRRGAVLCEQGYHTKRRDLNLAFQYFREGIAILENNKANDALQSAYDNYGVLFEMRNDLDSAYYFYNRALDFKIAKKDSIGIPYSLNKIAQLYLINKQYEKALTHFNNAYKMRESVKDKFGIMENKSFYGDLYQAWGKYKDAIQWYLRSNGDAVLLTYPMLLQYNHEQLAICYNKLGLYKEAYEAIQRSATLKDQLLNDKNSKTILELEQRFLSAEKDKNISRLETESAKKKLTIYIMVALSVILLLGAVIYTINSKKIARAAKDAAIIEEREAGLRAVFDATEEERKRIAKDLHDGLGQQLSGLRLSWEGLENKIFSQAPEQAEKLNQLTSILDEACTEVRSISHTMMPKVLQEKGLLAAIDEMAFKSLGISSIQYQLEHFKIENQRFHERIELSLYRICQELINNILKHSKATEVVIQLMKSKGHLVLRVEDNGVGFDKHKSKDGIGMMNITSRLSTINGQSEIAPGPERGVVATIRVPVE